MWLSEVSVFLFRNANEVCFFLALAVLALFYRQYKIYEAEAEREEMIEEFLSQTSVISRQSSVVSPR